MTTEFAPAKVNLTLHVTGQRDDGYHLLDSLVMFADVGDRLDIFSANTLSLTIEGPMAAGVPADMSNSIMKCAQLFKPQEDGAALLLTKNLPTAAGIGGGSADAAAAFRGLMEHWGPEAPETLFHKGLDLNVMTKDEAARITEQVKALGADVPVCLFCATSRMRGIGEKLEFYRNIPKLHAVLVNPGVAVSTPDIFNALTTKGGASMSEEIGPFLSSTDFVKWLALQRNDLQPAAISQVPKIGEVLAALKKIDGCALSRMSGSGATCFGLFETQHLAAAAATMLETQHPNWWVRSCILGG
ncbi:4-(cytidine 5'-diphospho)-2-C-methyl-D-erythritol kinase [Litoreibacter sp.]|nr:4-(cytidine 5'-diphospho)-2-C-methyl-D-erythritol kinase [Litoreibacter sp.]